MALWSLGRYLSTYLLGTYLGTMYTLETSGVLLRNVWAARC